MPDVLIVRPNMNHSLEFCSFDLAWAKSQDKEEFCFALKLFIPGLS